ncbi:putative hydrolase family protein [Tanacetum coccineum]
MKFRTISKIIIQTKNKSSSIKFHSYRAISHFHSTPKRGSFGIAFDIDGVILRGSNPIGNSPNALKRLYNHSEQHLEYDITLPCSWNKGHSHIRKSLLKRFENELIVATGKGEPAVVMSEYGFKKVISLDEYASFFNSIDPLSPYKTWTTKQPFHEQRSSSESVPDFDVTSERVKAAFVVSDPVLCDILRSGGLPGEKSEHQPDMYFAADDLEYQAVFPSERLGMGAFRIALESIFNSIHHKPLEYTSFGKPNPFVFKNAEFILKQLQLMTSDCDVTEGHKDTTSHHFETLYMIGDNPSVDIKGAKQAGHPWFSILTRTGVFRGKENHTVYPADQIVDTVEEAVEYILQREGHA